MTLFLVLLRVHKKPYISFIVSIVVNHFGLKSKLKCHKNLFRNKAYFAVVANAIILPKTYSSVYVSIVVNHFGAKKVFKMQKRAIRLYYCEYCYKPFWWEKSENAQ